MFEKLKELFKPKQRSSWVSVAGREQGSYLVASTEQVGSAGGIRARLEKAQLIEATVNPQTATKLTSLPFTGVEYPEDFNEFQNYLDAYYYVPYIARAVDVKQFMIWQMGYDLESESVRAKKSVEDLLKQIQADIVIREGTLYALIFGNMYWRISRSGDKISLTPLNPMKIGIRLDKNKEKVEAYVYQPRFGKKEEYKPKEILHLKFNAEPWALFGISTLRRVIPTVKAILFMEEKLPWIARRRADPLLSIGFWYEDEKGRKVPLSSEECERWKKQVLARTPGKDIFHDGCIHIEEVYKSSGIAARQAIEPLLSHFRENLIAGLGVPEPALGFGGTTTQATAEYQERILEAEVRAYQRALKRMHEQYIFSLVEGGEKVRMVFRPLKEEDKAQLSKVLQGEIEHGIVSPKWARQRLGYPDEAGEGTVIDQRLVPSFEKPEGEKEEKVIELDWMYE